jgi:serine/threonine protein kinase
MPAPSTAEEFLKVLAKSQLVPAGRLEAFIADQREPRATTPRGLADRLVDGGLVTRFQADQLLKGKFRGFSIGKYRVLDRLGAGGMGQVFLCEHPHLRRRAAVKVLPTDRAGDPALLGRFIREARAAAALDHPNIVRAFDVDEDRGLNYLVMEYVDGIDLYQLVKRDGPLPVEKACEYMRQGALGLQHAHESGLIHRDIKPSNFLVDKVGVVKLLDLGLARFAEEGPDHLTQRYDNNNVLGTADYVAPEQTRDSHEVDQRCDIYALGGTLYFLLSGLAPFPDGSPADKMIAHRMRKPIPVRQYRPDVPPGLALVLEKMMAKNPDERYASAADVAAALAPWLPNPPAGPSEALLPTPASLMAPALPRRRRLSLGWPAAAVFVMLACGAGALAGRWLLSPDAVARTTGSR